LTGSNTITILGSSSGLPQAGRATAGYALNVGSDISLIDCGGGVTSSFLACGLDPLDVERIFISHTHPDHCCDLPLFLQLEYLNQRTKSLELFLPDEFVEPFKAYLNAVYVIPEKMPFELVFNGYSDGFKYSGNFSLKAIGNAHLKGYTELIDRLGLPNKMQCHSFEIEVAGKTIFYSADVADLSEVTGHLDGKALVIAEPTHLDFERFLQIAQTAKVGKYVVSHLGNADEVERIEQMARKAGIDNLITAIDGLRIDL